MLLCDQAGVIGMPARPWRTTATRRHSSPAPGRWTSCTHDDVAAVQQATAGGRLACRVRAADGTGGTWRGACRRTWKTGGPDLLLVTGRDMSDQVALRQQVTQLTFHDGATGLPNRSYVEERVKDQFPAAAIFVDLDGFTAINDSVGHGAGDLVLAQAGRRIRGLVPARGHRRPVGWRRVRGADRDRGEPAGDRRHRRTGGGCHSCGAVRGSRPVRSPSLRASAWRSPTPIWRGTCCAMPTSPCPGPRTPVAAASSSSPRTCTPM